ncbi:helix-turn-helix domain-containing protein [Candidatus Woesebacteria bacterium]|nr:helix-turn-helix domain-containing protein [Candidatus Woesebacteria bacterium]
MLTVGQILKKQRLAHNLTLKQAEETTKIRERYLNAIEMENWSQFTSRVYIAGVIKSYASYLGIDPEKAMAYFRRDYEKKERVTFKKRLPSLHILPETKKLVYILLGAVFVFFSLYFTYQFKQFLSPPEITIISPQERVFRNVSKIRVIGKTIRESTVLIYNEELFPDENGEFSYEFPLKKGLNTLQIQVTGPNGKKNQLVQEYVLE